MEMPSRKANRLGKHDYSRSGHYFTTVCTQNRRSAFGDIVDEKMILNEAGRIVAESWEWMGRRYDHVELDAWAVMPNHLHGIVIIHDMRTDENVRRGGSGTARARISGRAKPLGRLIGAFKTVSAKRISEHHGAPEIRLWQRSFYDRIIRDEAELNRIREYIRNNPLRWSLDEYNPDNRTGP